MPRATSTDEALEREVQRRIGEIFASAGVAQGRLSLEVLYMLPPEFVKGYTSIFDRALTESVVGSGSGRGGQAVSKKISRTPRLSPRGKQKMAQSSTSGGGGSGKRFRQHWVIRDERALKYKSSIDRKLRRLARDMLQASGKLSLDEHNCSNCQTDLTPHEELGYKIHFCPRCGLSF